MLNALRSNLSFSQPVMLLSNRPHSNLSFSQPVMLLSNRHNSYRLCIPWFGGCHICSSVCFQRYLHFWTQLCCRGRICWRWLTFPKFYFGISTQGRSKYCTKRMVPGEPSGNKNKIQFWHGTVPPALGDPRMELREQQLTKRFIKSSPPSTNYTSRKRTGACC